MANSHIEFFVEKVTSDKRGRTVVVGFPNNEKALHVGDTFLLSYDISRSYDDILRGCPMPEPTNYASVNLTVTAIDSMRVLVDELPPGVTGGLYLSGEGIEHVVPKRYLRTGIG